MQFSQPSFVTIDGRKLAYDEVSPANPKGVVLLLTGLGSKRLGWYKQMQAFGQHFRTLALDHREVGDSDVLGEPYTTTDQADDAAAFLRALGIDRAHVVGISMGGFVSLELTLRHPELVDRLVLTATSAGGSTHVYPAPEMLTLLMERQTLEIGELARKTYQLIAAPGHFERHPDDWDTIAHIARYRPLNEATYFRQLQACLGHNASDRLEQIGKPTLVIHGDSDPLVPFANGAYLAQQISGAKLLTYAGCGHVPIIERPEDYNRDVLEFLHG